MSVYSLVANNVPVNSKIIGPNEHESHHLYDVIYSNKSDINIDMVTGDNHSINQINFVALDSIDVSYIPSIKNIRAESKKLYSSQDLENYTGLIKPQGKLRLDLIRSQRRGILKVLLSLIMQENTQSIIIRKLSSHKRYSRLREALWEYNKVFKSTHVLNLINDVSLRKVIKSARNRTEAYHQLQGIIRKIYNGVFKGRKIVDNEISNQASRFVTNCIIAYNAIILDNVYQDLARKHGEEKAKKMLAKISPVAWRHILFTGRYNFLNRKGGIDIRAIAKILEESLEKDSG